MPDRPTATRSRRLGGRLRHDERGVALTEMALVLPLLLLLLLGMIDFGKAINYWLDETHLANEGARWAAVGNWPGKGTISLPNYILGQGDTRELRGKTPGTQGSNNTAKVCVDYGTGAIGSPVSVTVTYDYHWLHYLTNEGGVGPSTTVTGKATMRIESNPDKSTGVTCTS